NLGLLETVRGRREIRAGVYELTIQPQFVEVGANVVMVMNVLPRTARRVGLPPLAPAFRQSRIPARPARVWPRSIERFEQRAKVSLNLDATVCVCIAEVCFRVDSPPRQSGLVPDSTCCHRRPAAKTNLLAVPQRQTDRRIAGPGKHAVEQSPFDSEQSQPSLTGSSSVPTCRHNSLCVLIFPFVRSNIMPKSHASGHEKLSRI